MLRPRFAAALAVISALASHAASAQTSGPANYISTVQLTPEPTGLAAGLFGWPAASYCSGQASASGQAFDVRTVLARVQLAARCGVRLILVPPRRLLTADGRPNGVFSVDSAKRFVDRYAAVLPPDTLAKYRATLLGLNLADDYGCRACWGGQPITQAEIAEWAVHARAKLPGLPLGVRVTPDWVAAHPPLAPLLDYTWAQYHTKKGTPEEYFERAATTADRLGLSVVMGVNLEDCYGVGTAACSAEELARYGALAVSHPASCAFLNWRYRQVTWAQEDFRAAWQRLAEAARARPVRECRRMK